MQNPNDDTEWNDVLRAKGILPPKPKELEIDEDSVVEVSFHNQPLERCKTRDSAYYYYMAHFSRLT